MKGLRGLYAITPEMPAAREPIAEQVRQAIAGGARMVQYRDKSGHARKRLGEARSILSMCRAAGVPLIINDDPQLAAQVGAHGAHLGRDDVDPAAARSQLGGSAIIGVSCYDSLERAVRAERAGASYVAFGRFFPSSTKPLAVQATPDLLEQARKRLAIPLVAIGGITPENGRGLIAAGADMLAVVEAVFGAPDIGDAAAALSELFPVGDCDP